MASSCIQTCINDTHLPIRATYVNLYKWPESDAKFIENTRALPLNSIIRKGVTNNTPRTVDCVSCRQIYLRSYPFSRKESVQEKTLKCIEKVKEKVVKRRHGGGVCLKKPCVVMIRKAKEVTYAALFSVFQRLLSCTAKIDVV